MGGTDYHFVTGLDTLRLFSSELAADLSAECLEVVDGEANNQQPTINILRR